MRQIQYPPLAQPPALTPSTAASGMGWAHTYPDAVRAQARGWQAACYQQPYEQSVGATVFAVAQWAVPGKVTVTIPDNPQQFSNRREYLTRGGGSRGFFDTQSHAVFAVEQFPQGTTLGWGCELPDDPRLGRRPRLDPASLGWCTSDPKTPVAATVLGWGPELPDDPRLGRRPGYPTATLAPQADWGAVTDVPVMSWTGSFVDDAWQGRRRQLPTAAMPFVVRPEAQEAWQVLTPLMWQPRYPDRTTALSLPRALYPSVFKAEPIEPLAPTLLWSVCAPADTSRRSLPTAQLQTTFYTNTFPLTVTFPWIDIPDQTRQARLPIALYPSAFRGEAPEQFLAPVLSWAPSYPDTTRRATLPTATLPTFTHSEALAQAPPTLQWSVQAPMRVPIAWPQTRIDGFTIGLIDVAPLAPAIGDGKRGRKHDRKR